MQKRITMKDLLSSIFMERLLKATHMKRPYTQVQFLSKHDHYMKFSIFVKNLKFKLTNWISFKFETKMEGNTH